MAKYVKVDPSNEFTSYGRQVASEKHPCPLCRSASVCCWKVNGLACEKISGPLSEKSVFMGTEIPCHIHPVTEECGRLTEMVPDDLNRFIECIFEPEDIILIRPTEIWEEIKNNKHSKNGRICQKEKTTALS